MAFRLGVENMQNFRIAKIICADVCLLQATTRDNRQEVLETEEPVQEPMLISSQVPKPSTCFNNESQ